MRSTGTAEETAEERKAEAPSVAARV